MLSTTGDAVRPLGLLAGGVGADRRAVDDGAGVHGDVTVAGDRDREAVHAAWSGASLLLADPVVLREEGTRTTGSWRTLARGNRDAGTSGRGPRCPAPCPPGCSRRRRRAPWAGRRPGTP